MQGRGRFSRFTAAASSREASRRAERGSGCHGAGLHGDNPVCCRIPAQPAHNAEKALAQLEAMMQHATRRRIDLHEPVVGVMARWVDPAASLLTVLQ